MSIGDKPWQCDGVLGSYAHCLSRITRDLVPFAAVIQYKMIRFLFVLNCLFDDCICAHRNIKLNMMAMSLDALTVE